jgi:hypothetical protein
MEFLAGEPHVVARLARFGQHGGAHAGRRDVVLAVVDAAAVMGNDGKGGKWELSTVSLVYTLQVQRVLGIVKTAVKEMKCKKRYN